MNIDVIIAMGLMAIFAIAFISNVVDLLIYAIVVSRQEKRYKIMSDPDRKTRRELYYENMSEEEKETIKIDVKDHSKILNR
jgi:NhaP-type Na+/H+ and K+/H+ antiporter